MTKDDAIHAAIEHLAIVESMLRASWMVGNHIYGETEEKRNVTALLRVIWVAQDAFDEAEKALEQGLKSPH